MPGQLIFIGEPASVQFQGARALRMRVIRVDEQQTYEGWLWLDGYVINARGDAVERRTVFVRQAGLRRAVIPRARRFRPTDRGQRLGVIAARSSGMRRSSREPATRTPIRYASVP